MSLKNIFKSMRGMVHVNNLRHILNESIKSVQPKQLINDLVNIENNILKINQKCYHLNRPVYIIGFGKAVHNMANELEQILNKHLTAGIISVPKGSICHRTSSKILFRQGALNNIPDFDSMNTTREILDFIKTIQPNSLLIILISGGGSALFVQPIDSISLDEKISIIRYLSLNGASISELNCVRQQISAVKGGKLANKIHPIESVALIISDIVGDPIELIASGPTVLTNHSKLNAQTIIKKYFKNIPKSIENVLFETKNETLTSTNLENIIIGNNKKALSVAYETAKSFGYNAFILTDKIEGNVKDVSLAYYNLFQAIHQNKNDVDDFMNYFENNYFELSKEKIKELYECVQDDKHLVLLAGGETTVVVKGHGVGGRNQELALRFTKHLKENDGNVLFLSAGTDGIDGPTDAAGAFGFKLIKDLSVKQNLDLDEYLLENDSYNFYKRLNDGEYLIETGHTGTNVMDIHIILYCVNDFQF